ncbi:MAG: choice-of-anchor J domain-containing protein [bacterium]|nr:choice-of-anchor J domain-containing protein [bacterium]
MRRWLPIALVLAMAVMLCAGTPVAYKHPFAPATKGGATVSRTDPADTDYQLPLLGSRNPRTLDEVVLSEGFETTANNALPAGWTQVDVDAGFCTQFNSLSVWRVQTYNPHAGTKICFNHYNTNGTQNNDWLILPQQTLAGTITLSYWIASQDPLYLESYELKVSTTGTLPANFTNLIYSATNIDTTYTQHTHDLSAYAGAPFYIAFHYNAINEFVIKLDDVLLETSVAVPRGAIQCLVRNASTHNPIQNATVAVAGTGFTGTTAANGICLITAVPADTYSVDVSAANYLPVTLTNVIVLVNDTVDVTADLSPSVTAIDEGFEAVADNALPVGWIQVDVDNATCPDLLFPGEYSRWRVRGMTDIPAHSGSRVCLNHYNAGAAPNDDWLILPQQNLASPIALSYWIASELEAYPESYELRVSTTGTQPADFTNLIYSATDIPEAWTQHTHILSQFAGAPFYIAFHYNSTDKFVIKLDDVLLVGAGAMGGRIQGVVSNSATSSPLEEVEVSVLGTALTASTNAQGQYALTSVPPDTYTVRFLKAGYDTLDVEGVIVTVGDTVQLDVNLDPSGVENDGVLLPAAFAFYGNYPNPFNARTEFRFAVDRTGPVQLVLYNLMGQEAARVVDDVRSAGVYTVAFNAADLPSGLYLTRLTAGGRTAVHKTVLLK